MDCCHSNITPAGNQLLVLFQETLCLAWLLPCVNKMSPHRTATPHHTHRSETQLTISQIPTTFYYSRNAGAQEILQGWNLQFDTKAAGFDGRGLPPEKLYQAQKSVSTYFV